MFSVLFERWEKTERSAIRRFTTRAGPTKAMNPEPSLHLLHMSQQVLPLRVLLGTDVGEKQTDQDRNPGMATSKVGSPAP